MLGVVVFNRSPETELKNSLETKAPPEGIYSSVIEQMKIPSPQGGAEVKRRNLKSGGKKLCPNSAPSTYFCSM